MVARALLQLNPEIAAQPDRADEVIYALRATLRFDILFAHHPRSVRNVPELRSLGGKPSTQTGRYYSEENNCHPRLRANRAAGVCADGYDDNRANDNWVQSNLGPVSFALGTAARIVDGAGHIVTSALSPGQRVRVYYTGTGDTRAVEHVVVED